MQSDESSVGSARASEASEAGEPTGMHRLEDLLAQVEGRGHKRNGHGELLKRAATAEAGEGERG